MILLALPAIAFGALAAVVHIAGRLGWLEGLHKWLR